MKYYNQYYWQNKDGRTEKAKQHTKEMERKYAEEIKECVENTTIYDAKNVNELQTVFKPGELSMKVLKTDTVDALFKYSGDKLAVLNFASYKNAGGGFLNGSRAQEECLCHKSFLYNVLKEFEISYYEPNRKDLNRALYRDKALYSPDIRFEHDGKMKRCDVITCASPNFSAAERFVNREQNNKVMRQRIRFLLNIAKREGVDTLILGSWGCGVFQQDPEFVAKCFVEECKNIFTDTNIHVVFAVIPPLPNQTDNCTPFEKAVKDWNKNK